MSFYEKFYPKIILNSVLDITYDSLNKNNIQALLIDIDNTLIDYNNNVLYGIEKWAKELKSHGIKFCILSNTYKKSKAEKISKLIGAEYYIYFAKKPLKMGFKKAKMILNIDSQNIAVVGDQIITDVYGSNRCNMYSILVKPIKNKDILATRFNRMIERKILKKYYEEHKN